MFRYLEYIRLELKRKDRLTGEQRQRLAALDAEDERVGDRLADWEVPAILGMWALLLALGGVLLLAFGLL